MRLENTTQGEGKNMERVIIITGGSNGMGLYMAKRFIENGDLVIITGRDETKLQLAQSSVGKNKENLKYFRMDVRNIEEVKACIEYAYQFTGKVDGLINNAAGNFICRAEDLSLNGWNSVINIVLNGTFYMSQTLGKKWIENSEKGSILNIGTTYASSAGEGVIHSAAAKAGVLAITRTLAVEWGRRYGIRCNAIAPGPIERTGGADKLMLNKEAEEKTRTSIPLGRFGTPEEIAEIAFFLFSKEAGFINGEVIAIDGGQNLMQSPF